MTNEEWIVKIPENNAHIAAQQSAMNLSANAIETAQEETRTKSRDESEELRKESNGFIPNESTGGNSKKRKRSTRRYLSSSNYFNDGIRVIDFVLTYQVGKGMKSRARNQVRSKFMAGLRCAGLEIEHEGSNAAPDDKTGFVKVRY